MSAILIVILLLVGLLVASSAALSRTTREVDSARDTEYLELEGNWIRYSVTGGGPPVLLVHGWLSSSRGWRRLAERLAQRFTVYTLDLAGFGDSDKPISGYGIRYGSRLLYAFCAHFGLSRVAVIGHDVGGTMAMKLAADHPDVVGRLVLVATPADENQVDLPTLLWFATLPVIGPLFYTLGRFFRPLRRLWVRPFVLDAEDLTEEVVDDAGKSTPAAVSKTLSVMQREISRGRLVRQAGIVKIPVLLIAGEEDQIVDPRATDDWTRTVPAEVVFLDECGHLPMLERTAEFDARVLAFLTGDSRYLDTATEPQEEMAGEDLDAVETPEKPGPSARPAPGVAEPESAGLDENAEHGITSDVAREQDDRYPPRDEEAEDSDEGRLDSPEETEGDGEEGRPRSRDKGDAGTPIIETPSNLFDWPELKEPQPWDRSGETGSLDREERDVDVEPEAPEPEAPEPKASESETPDDDRRS
jgi:pimeloyl-ACP methyl ester carboxylesterase